MGLNIAFQMDPLETINIDTDSSFMMALEELKRGHNLYHYLPRQLVLEGKKLRAVARPSPGVRERGKHFPAGTPEVMDFAKLDLVMMRQDPPFDMSYIT